MLLLLFWFEVFARVTPSEREWPTCVCSVPCGIFAASQEWHAVYILVPLFVAPCHVRALAARVPRSPDALCLFWPLLLFSLPYHLNLYLYFAHAQMSNAAHVLHRFPS